jgi:hypothetical protein
MSVDAAAEWNRLADIYRQKSDDELQNIAAEAYDLTDTARDVLSAEIRDRKLPLTLSLGPAPEERSDIYDPSAEEEFKLAVVFEAKNPEELLAVTHILDDVDTPYVIGDENLERPEDFHGSFEKGVAVKVAFCEMVRVTKSSKSRSLRKCGVGKRRRM